MTLPASGAISLSDVNTELGRSATAAINMNEADVRELFGIAAGAIDMNTGHGRTRQVLVAGVDSDGSFTYIGHANATPFGTLTPAALGAHTVIAMYERKLTSTQAFQIFTLWISGINVPQNLFSTLKTNGQTYSSASATYDGNYFGNTTWTWSTPDPSLVDTGSYNAIFAP